MNRAELRLCIRWHRRDKRYLRGAYFSVMPRSEIEAVRAWRLDEAGEVGSVELARAALAWHPRELIRDARHGLSE